MQFHVDYVTVHTDNMQFWMPVCFKLLFSCLGWCVSPDSTSPQRIWLWCTNIAILLHSSMSIAKSNLKSKPGSLKHILYLSAKQRKGGKMLAYLYILIYVQIIPSMQAFYPMPLPRNLSENKHCWQVAWPSQGQHTGRQAHSDTQG